MSSRKRKADNTIANVFAQGDGSSPVKQSLFGLVKKGAEEGLTSSQSQPTPSTVASVSGALSLGTKKRFNDRIHNHISMDPLSLRIIDTPQYQRLRSLKQLGTCDYVFPGATHTRFEHSLGVAHLAETLVKTLQDNQPELCITANDVLSVKIAALCHDLGHGPFSHVYDGEFIRKTLPGTDYRHEDNSIKILDYLIQDNNIQLHQYGLVEKDKVFIDEVIKGTRESQRKGREPSKHFLYDIVNNSRSGLDVDKLDYFQRDTCMTNVMGGSLTLEVARFLDEGKVMKACPIHNNSNKGIGNKTGTKGGNQTTGLREKNGGVYPLMLCYPSKLIHSAVSLFATRYQMHQKVYTHKAVKQVEFMVTDVMMLANEEIKIPGNKTEKYPDGMYSLSECIECPKAFCYLKDSVLDVIEYEAERNPTNDKLRRAKELIHRIRRRLLYKCVGKATFTAEDNVIVAKTSDQDILEEIVELSRRQDIPDEHPSTPLHLTPSSSFTNVTNDENGIFSPRSEFGSPLQHSQPPTAGYFPPPSQEDSYSMSQEAALPLEKTDLIVDKMHLHHGMKADNPVSRLRFFGKGDDENQIARQVPEKSYDTILPRCFEERAVRVFCRKPAKEKKVKEAFEAWCKKRNVQLCGHELSSLSSVSSDVVDDISQTTG